jgi:hypothetical protein
VNAGEFFPQFLICRGAFRQYIGDDEQSSAEGGTSRIGNGAVTFSPRQVPRLANLAICHKKGREDRPALRSSRDFLRNLF